MLTQEEQIQGSEAWKGARKVRITATDTAKIKDVSPYSSRYDLYLEKLGLKEIKINPAMTAGSNAEESIRSWWESKTGELWMPAVMTHPKYDWCMASLDGIDSSNSAIFEAKFTSSTYFTMALDGRLPEHFMCQLAWGMFVSGAITAHCVLYNQAADDFAVVSVNRDDEYIAKLFCAAEDFYKEHLIPQIPPPFTERDYVPIDSVTALDAMDAWIASKSLLDAAKSGQDAARARLIDCGDDGNCIIGQVKLTKYYVQGTDFKAAALASGIDLSPFIKPTKVSWRLTIASN